MNESGDSHHTGGKTDSAWLQAQLGAHPWIGVGLAAALLVLATLIVYRPLLFGPTVRSNYPWASDTLGHVLKAEYLLAQLRQGCLYPDLFPDWYMGVQMLRYYPPLPYYLLVGLTLLMGNSVWAASVFIVLCALIGGLAWLPYRRWIGLPAATVGGMLYLFMPDNVRVALAEGNLPRVMATALLPLTVYLLLRALEEDGTRRHRLGLSLCFALIVLCHAMMAAIYAACCALLTMFCLVVRATTVRRGTLALVGVALGVLLSGWWFLPSLTGGITELDAAAMTEALAVFPLTTYLNPFLRLTDPEIVYPGAVLLLAAFALLWLPRGRTPTAIALILTGLFGVLISTPGFNALFNALPMSNLFWPLRFLGIAGFALLLGTLWSLRIWARRLPLVVALIAVLLAADGLLSTRLIYLRPAHTDLLMAVEQVRTLSGWREATLDHSKLGSAASYFFTARSGREQLYGWAYQGARTARNVAAINEGLQRGYTPYVLDRLSLYGADDVVLLHSPEIDPALPDALLRAGFQVAYRGDTLTLYHRSGAPRAFRARWPAIGIGRGAQNAAYLFPQMIIGSRPYLDDYTADELIAYRTLFLSGFEWRNRARAEALIAQVAQAGVQVVVDLTQVPSDPLAREPHFMGVWGEAIILPRGAIRIYGAGERAYPLSSFDVQAETWQTYTPQGLEVEVLWHNYLGVKSTVLGYNEVGTGKVWFIGLNLAYHAALTQDPAAVALLAELFNLPPGGRLDHQGVPLRNYVPSQAGYDFAYTLDTTETLLVPVAYHEGTEVQIDGKLVRAFPLENLVAFDAPAGEHRVRIRLRQTNIYLLGHVASGLALIGVIGLWFIGGKRRNLDESAQMDV